VAQPGRDLVLHLCPTVPQEVELPSLDDLTSRKLTFIDYFNNVLGKPFRWTYTGRPLRA